jgi:amino acid transporter
MADKSQAHDKQVLHKLGYAQELARRMSGFSNFAISFSIICILAGGITTFPVALSAGGGFSVAVGWFLGGIAALIVAFGMGQIASAFPTAGGLYHWSSHLGGKAWGWATAWLNLLGLVFVVSSVDVGVYLLFKDLFLATALGVDVSSWGAVHQAVGVLLLLFTQALFNHYGIDVTTKLTDFSGYLIFVIAAVLVIALLAFSPVALDFSRLITFTNFSGDAGGGVFPFHQSVGFVFLLGLLFVCYTITGFDASAHTSEETHDAQVNVPKGMWTAVFWSWVSGLIMVSTFVLTMPSVEEGAATGWGSFYYILGSSRMPSALLVFLAAGIVIANYLCALAGLTSCSRMMYAFSRDGGLPASKTLSQVSTTYRTPTYSIWTSAVIAWLSTLYAGAFVVLATGCAVFLYLSYVMPVAAGFFSEGKTWKEKGPFNLGGFSKINAVLAVVVGVVLAITGFFPPNEKVFYLTIAMVVVMIILWYTVERNRFEGVPEGDKIVQRQKMIAEIEKKYGEQ